MDLARLPFGKLTIACIAGLSFLLFSCKNQGSGDDAIEPLNLLSFKDKARIARYQKGNLIPNSSFELGNTIRLDSLHQRYVIESWEQVGSGISWELLNSTDSSNRRFIAIKRTLADETEVKGSGLLSDFVRVIPGTYTFTCWLNLMHIKNPLSRLGTSIYDAVQLRILYYDRNHVLLNDISSKNYLDYNIDQGFQSLSVANFDKIDSTGWVKVLGRTHNAPYPQGIMPEEAKFIRLFIGLKGTGELWADKVSFSYSSQNISLFERVKLQSNIIQGANKLFPLPKYVQFIDTLSYLNNSVVRLPIVIYSNQKSEAERQMVSDLKKYFLSGNKLTSKDILLVSDASNPRADLLKNHLVIAIGESQFLTDHPSTDSVLNSKPIPAEGYKIWTLPGYYGLHLQASTASGYQYGFRTLKQLINQEQGTLITAQMFDYPAVKLRGCWFDTLGVHSISVVKALMEAGFSHFGIQNKDAAHVLTESGVKMDQIQSLFIEGTSMSDVLQGTQLVFSCDNPFESVNKVTFSKLVEQSVMPEIPSMQLKKSGSFPWYAHTGYLFGHMQEARLIHQFTDVSYRVQPYYWVGNSPENTLDDVSLYAFYSVCEKYPVLVDMSLHRNPQFQFVKTKRKSRQQQYLSLVEPYYVKGLSDEALMQLNGVILHQHTTSATGYIRLLTALDYLWNPEGYQPMTSLYRALTYYGLSDYEIELYLLGEELLNELIENIHKLAADPSKQKRVVDVILQNNKSILDELNDQKDILLTNLANELKVCIKQVL